MRPDPPKLVKDAQRLRAMIEEAFTRMARRHKYPTGTDIRAAAKTVVMTALRAWRDREQRLAHASALIEAVDVLVAELQLGKDVDAFSNFNEFEAISRLADEVGKQSGGWVKALRLKGQNAPAQSAQRALTLSARDASQGAIS